MSYEDADRMPFAISEDGLRHAGSTPMSLQRSSAAASAYPLIVLPPITSETAQKPRKLATAIKQTILNKT